MKLFFTDQQKEFPRYLEEFKRISVIPYQAQYLNHKLGKQVIECNFSELSLSGFFNYEIFPVRILSAYTQWDDERRSIQTGDTIVQQINIPPFKSLSQRVIVRVRIKEIFNTEICKGFSYETLNGHVEKGISSFRIEPDNNRSVFTIETYSSPDLFTAKLFQPLSSLYQDYCTNQALANVKRKLS